MHPGEILKDELEALSMRWDNIDFEWAVWSKPASVTKQKRDHPAPLTDEAVALLRARCKANAGEWVFPARYSPTSHLTSIRVFWTQVCKRAKITDCHIHDLRHTFASLAARQGVSLPVVGGLLGHSDHKTTSRYLHLCDDPLRAGAAAVAGLMKTKAAKLEWRVRRGFLRSLFFSGGAKMGGDGNAVGERLTNVSEA